MPNLKPKSHNNYHLLLIIAFYIQFSAFGQNKALTTNDFAQWKRIENRQISNDGAYISYEINEQKGNGKLLIYKVDTKITDTIPYGYAASFSPDNDFIIFKYKPDSDTIRAAKKAKLNNDKIPKDSAGIYAFNTKKTYTYSKIKSSSVPLKNGNWAAILIDHQKPTPDTTANDSVKSKTPVKKDEKNLKDLVVIQPSTGYQTIFNHVEDYIFAKSGSKLAIVTKEKDSVQISSLIIFDTKKCVPDTILKDTGWIKQPAIDDQGSLLAFLFSSDTINEKRYALKLTDLQKNKTETIADSLTKGIPNGFSPSENGNIFFSDDATKLYFGTAKTPLKQPEDSLLDEEKPKLDVWSWTDKELQPMQLINAANEKKRTYLAVYRIKEKKLLQLADSVIREIKLINKNNGEYALGLDDQKYLRASSWTGQLFNDIYLVDLKTGQRELVIQRVEKAYLSPDGAYIVWFNYNDSNYYCKNIKTKTTTNLSQGLKVAFYDELNDLPTIPELYGISGWGDDRQSIYIYDRFDIWRFDLSNASLPVNITNNFGRKNKISLRYKKVDKELDYLPLKDQVILQAFNENTFEAGYFTAVLKFKQDPKTMIIGNFKVDDLMKAKNTDKLIWSTQTVKQYPEIKLSSLSFTDSITISSTNPQQSNYVWATSETVQWISYAGDTLKGILYKPDDFDPQKKYPMVIYFYERNSFDIHHHFIPYPSHSTINRTFYASNGYLVFVPDIVYKTGHPGKSAYDAIVSGTRYLANNYSFVDTLHIGLQGQSWGGYQTAYLITQTNLYACAMAGAPVSNMTSAYGGIRWSTGMSRMFQYEHTQSRIGATLWEKTDLYLENSPLFYAPKVNTPLLIMHNDNDGSVPWYQGIEYFVALRRLDKPAWLLNYNGMEHNIDPKYWANRMDLSIRMLQFFNHYLKDEPAPKWMTEGLKAVDKGNDLGY